MSEPEPEPDTRPAPPPSPPPGEAGPSGEEGSPPVPSAPPPPPPPPPPPAAGETDPVLQDPASDDAGTTPPQEQQHYTPMSSFAAPSPPSAPSPPPEPAAVPSASEHGGGAGGSGDDPDAELRALLLAVRDEVGKVVVGQDGAMSGLVGALLAGGHVLLEGVPGVAKTLIVKAVAAGLDLDFKRVQFTPDLMPSDVTGQLVLEGEDFRFRRGPIFTDILLADEINRTPPKTQAALLEAMEERQVTSEGAAHRLPVPFTVVATQNPIEYEGTYPLPEAQLDRFLFKLHIGYPSAEQEQEVLARHDTGLDPHDVVAAGIRPVATASDLARARQAVAAVRVEPHVQRYIVELARATRSSPSVSLGVSPRGGAMLLHAAKAWAWLVGRSYVTPDEVKAVVKPCLRHRIQIRPELEIEGTTVDGVLDGILAQVPVPR